MLFCFCFGDDKKPTDINTDKKPLVHEKLKKPEQINKDKNEKVVEKLPSNTKPNDDQPIYEKKESTQKVTPSFIQQSPISIFEMSEDEKARENWDEDGRIYGDGRELYGDGTISHMEHPSANNSKSQHSELFMGDLTKNLQLPDPQQEILDNDDLQNKCYDLLTEYNGAFILFTGKYLTDKVVDKIWQKLDNDSNGYIETSEDIANAIAFMAMMYKVRMYQKKNKTKEKPKFKKSELLDEVQHISMWIVKKYGKKDDSIDKLFVYRVTKNEFKNGLKGWMDEYVKNDGDIVYGTSLKSW